MNCRAWHETAIDTFITCQMVDLEMATRRWVNPDCNEYELTVLRSLDFVEWTNRPFLEHFNEGCEHNERIQRQGVVVPKAVVKKAENKTGVMGAIK
jgi:hypothetical protein